MTNTQDHSTGKLALAILTSPTPAFQEVVRRQMLGTAFTLVALTGAISMLGAFARVSALGPAQWFALGKDNPITWVGLWMLYALAMQKLLKWLGTEIDYPTSLIILGWSHVLLLLHQVAGTFWSFIATTGDTSQTMLQVLTALRIGLPVLYVIVVGTGVQAVTGSPLSRGLMTYFVISAAAAIAFDYTYGGMRLKPFEQGLQGIVATVARLAPRVPDPWLTAPDQFPKVGGAAAGLALGLWFLAKTFAWPAPTRNRFTAIAAAVGVLFLGGYSLALHKVDYYGRLAHAQELYDVDKFGAAAAELETLRPILKDSPWLTLDAADCYYLAGDGERSIKRYDELIRSATKAKLSKEDRRGLAQPYACIGAVYDAQGQYDLALKQFELASKVWPEARDPWVRMAVTYARMGKYDKTIEAGEHATKKLGSKAAPAYAALAQAYAQAGDAKQAKAAYEKLGRYDDELAEKIGDKPDGWRSAVSKLTRSNLKYPMERQPAPTPPRPKTGQQPRK